MSSGEIGPFEKKGLVLGPLAGSIWNCPLAGPVAWEAKDVFNPAAVVRDGLVHLLYRAEDTVGRCMGTSRIGLATSRDGLTFEREPAPVLFPTNDLNRGYEWEGGCEDPRVCTHPDGGYVMTYTAFDGHLARLCVATSPDLCHWTKHGLAFPTMPNLWSKSGSIVCRLEGDQLVAARIDGLYWMYWGESYVFAATSSDLITWEAVTHPVRERTSGMPSPPSVSSSWSPHEVGASVSEREALVAVLRPRAGRFDGDLVEPGPPALLTDRGILLMVHGKNASDGGDPNFPAATYGVQQVLFDPCDPTAVLARSTRPFLFPEEEYEITGQVGNVCFAEGLVPFGGQWLLYYGTADSKIAVARAPMLK